MDLLIRRGVFFVDNFAQPLRLKVPRTMLLSGQFEFPGEHYSLAFLYLLRVVLSIPKYPATI